MQILNSTVFGIPVWVLAVGLIGGGIAIYLLRRNASSSSGTLGQNTSGQTTAAPALDQSLYDPYTGAPLAAETAINPATGLPNYYNTGSGQTGNPGTTGINEGNQGGPGPNPSPIVPGPPPGPAQHVPTQYGTVRASGSVPQYAGYDASHPQGVPLESSPGLGNYAGFVPYGSQVQVSGPGVQGTSNTGQTGGTTLWYPVAGGGYISAADLNGSPHGGARGPDTGTDFWPYMTDMAVWR